MFTVQKGATLTVHTASSFTRKDGVSGAVIIFLEKENQPENIERPSRANNPVKVWCARIPEGVKNGTNVKLIDFDGFDWKHLPSTYHKGSYDEVIELINPTFELA